MQHTQQPKINKGSIIRLIATARDANGQIISTQTKDNDIYLWAWAVLITQMLKIQFAPDAATTYGFTNLSGVSKTTTNNFFAGVTQSDYANTWRVQVGSSSKVPAISDYALTAYLMEAQPTQPEIVVAGQILKIVFSTTFQFQTETIVAEIGIRGYNAFTTPNIAENYLLTRDTITPVTVPAGGTVTLQHELWFNGTP